MIDPENIKVSTYSRIWIDKKNPEQPKNLYLVDILDGIKTGKWKADQENYIQSGFDQKVKKNLPNFAPSGVFKAANESGLTEPSGLICLDFNHLEDLDAARVILDNDRFVKYFFKSVSGTGYFALIEIDKNKFYEAFDGLEKYFIDNYGLIPNPKGRFLSTRRIFSYDPDAKTENVHNDVFKLYLPKKKPGTKAAKTLNISSDKDIEHVIKQIENREIDVTGSFSNWYKIGHGIISTYQDKDKALDYFSRISQFNPDYDPDRIQSLFNYLCDTHDPEAKIGVLYSSARELGIDPYTDKTLTVAKIANMQRKSGATAAAVIISLNQMDGIEPEYSTPIVESVFADEGEIETEESTIEQIELYLKRNYPMRYNLIERQTELLAGTPLTDRIVNGLYVEMKKNIGKEVTKQDINAVIESPLTPSFNPLIEFFERNRALRPTGNIKKLADSITPILNSYADREFPIYVEYFLKRWLVGLIASAHGDASPLMLVLTGGKNTGKTQYFRRMLPAELSRYFDDSKQESVKDEEILLATRWMILDDEYGGKNKQEAKRFKELSSKQKITQRAPYEKRAETIDRLAVFCGTSNDNNILNDPTGNRRIIPIEVKSINHALYNSIDKTELLMEVYHLYKEGWTHHLTDDEIAILDKCTLQFEQPRLEKELISKYFAIPEPGQLGEMLTSTDIKVIIEKASIQRVSLPKIGQELRAMGFAHKSFRRNGTAIWGYEVFQTKITIPDTEDTF